MSTKHLHFSNTLLYVRITFLYRSERFLAFPIGFDIEAEDLIRKLLTPNPTFRLGNLSGGVRDIIEHPWFRNNGFNWQQVCTTLYYGILQYTSCTLFITLLICTAIDTTLLL
jgi:hypothetical protein